MIVSLYNWQEQLTNPVPLAMNSKEINFTNIHAYSQGKYIASTLTEQSYNDKS
jgi:hypothetical protein